MSNSLPRIKKVDIVVIEEGEEKTKKIVVQKQGLGKWKQLSDSLEGLNKKIPQIAENLGYENTDSLLDDLTVDNLLDLVPKFWSTIIDEIVNILVLGTEADEDFISKHVGPYEVIKLLKTIIEVNQLIKVVEEGKNLPFLRSLMGPTPQIASTQKKLSTDSSGGSKK